MKYTVKTSLILLSSVLIIFFASSCHKKNTSFDYNQAMESVADYVEAQQMTDLLLNTYFKSITDSLLLTDGEAIIDGANVTYSGDSTLIVINYYWAKGDGYGHLREGKYEASTETSIFDSLAVVNFTFNDFFYDSAAISVENLSITNMGINVAGNQLFDVNANDIFRVDIDTTRHFDYSLRQNFIRIKDSQSAYYTDNDYFKISGSMTGIDRNGNTFNSVTLDTNSILAYYSCNWIKGGITEVELPDFVYNASINFSNEGECLNQYSIITNETLFIKVFDGD